ncbi:MAG: flagellar motor switch protein FliN [Deltaproteobacteria bacterium]|jgi:flagellar motor switch protein FliN/FliY|nr:flagellar motor switch protein FliN [Deltaproteobacteria bacterium]MCL5891821.1 flagellar motor switch protein FliN [Deltaproteobacteria bacterium]
MNEIENQRSSIENQQGPAEKDEKITKSDVREEPPKDIQPGQEQTAQEDDNVSWEDAFKEEAMINQKSGENSPAVNTAEAGRENLNLDVKDVHEAAKNVNIRKPVKKVEFSSFDETDKTAEPPKNLDFILDIPLTISVELGRTKMVINDMLQLGQGSVIELAKLAGEPLDVYVNGKLMARGEVVLVNDKFGVRLTDIISPAERIKTL